MKRKLQKCLGCNEWFNTTDKVMFEHRLKCKSIWVETTVETNVESLFEYLKHLRNEKYELTKTITI